MAGFPRLGVFTTSLFNNMLDALELWASRNGKGVLSGLELTAGAGLNVTVSAGSLLGLRAVSLALQSVALAPNETTYLWIDEDGDVTPAADGTDPGGAAVCLGTVTTDVDSVVSVGTTGRMETARWLSRVFRIGPGTVEVDTEQGEVRIACALRTTGHVFRPVIEHILEADLELPATWPNVVRVTPDTAGRKIILPADPELGLDFEICNDGAEDVLLRDPTDTTTVSTIEPGQRVLVWPTVVAGVATWPTVI